MVRRYGTGRAAVALLGAALASLCQAQPAERTTESQARYYVYGAFLTHAVPEIMGEPVALGPELEQRLGLSPGADRLRIYDALMSYTDGRRITVRKATADELAKYRPQAKRDLKEPVFRVQADDIALLVEYDMAANTIPFVGQLAVASEPPRPVMPPKAAPLPVVEQREAPVAVVAPAPKPAPRPVAVAAPKPEPAKVAPPLVKPQARMAPPPPPAPARPEPRATGPCEVKPVMTEQDLVNCRAASTVSPRIDPGPPPRPQARSEARQPERRKVVPCVIKPVMSEEDRIACGIR